MYVDILEWGSTWENWKYWHLHIFASDGQAFSNMAEPGGHKLIEIY